MEATNKEVIFTRPHKTIYATEDKIIKVFDNRYTKADVLNEARNEALVELNTDLNIPSLVSVEETPEGWCLVRDKVEGKTLQQMMDEEPEKLETYMEMFVDLQLKVHSQKVNTIKRLRHKLMDQINSLKDLDATARYELATRLESMPKHNKICHGDFNPSNIIVREDGTACILDWSHATQGNASADAARTYLLFCLNGDKEGAKKYLELFCRKSDTALQYVQKWMPIVAASQLVKSNESERDFLLSWVSVVDYQ